MKVQLATRVDQALRRRLRVHAAVTGRTVEDVVNAALDCYLPAMPEMAAAVAGSAPAPDAGTAGS
jgi:plasmid stability protein